MMRNRLIYLFLLVLAAKAAALEIDTAGKLFLLGAGARSDGLGGCGTLLGEAYGGLFNPAAQVLIEDLAGTVYSNPQPYFQHGYDFLVLSASARTEFGCLGANYLSRNGVEGSAYPPEEASALVLSGNPWKKLSLGVGFKILTSQKANYFVPVNETGSSSYKMGFDLGVVYSRLLPQTTLGRAERWEEPVRLPFARSFVPGLALGLSLQNLGGKVEYNYALDFEMLPQTFRADLLWGAYRSKWVTVRCAGQLEKLLVARNENGGYEKATETLLTAWGGGENEGGWTSRLGMEATFFHLASARWGWSVDHGSHRSFTHVGLGAGPEWLCANFAWVREPGTGSSWRQSLRLDVTANVTFEQVQGWMGRH